VISDPRLSLLSKIDLTYWHAHNPYYSEQGLNKSMKRSLTLLKSRGFLRGFYPQKASDISEKIRSEIDLFNVSAPNYERLAFVFDLIQAWGGQTGRSPYIKRRGRSQSSRDRFPEWKSDYLLGVEAAKTDSPVEALRFWRKIEGVGASFAPKHLMFWSNKYPILDTRISILMCGSSQLLKSPETYGTFLTLITTLSESFDASLLEVERGLFAFSQNYFYNGRLEFHESARLTDIDLLIAEQLVSLSYLVRS
jgi:hypothetical protein